MQNIRFIQNYNSSSSTKFIESRVRIGLNKLSSLLAHHEYDTEVSFIGAPDFSMTLNEERFRGGFSVGGILKWGNGDIPVIPLQIMPNCCGAILAKISHVDIEHIIKVIESIKNEEHNIGGLRIQWDVSRKNHFFNIYSTQNGELYAILHCSLPETKLDNILGTGTYFTQSNLLSSKARKFDCTDGQLVYLHGESAINYFEQIKLYDDISKQKRQYIISLLFPKNEIISNENHLTFLDLNTVLLGCYSPKTNNVLLPLTIGPYEKAYILSPNVPFEYNPGTLYYILPHGAGTKLKIFDELEYKETTSLFITQKGGITSYTKEISQLTNGYNSLENIHSQEFEKFYSIKEILHLSYQFRL